MNKTTSLKKQKAQRRNWTIYRLRGMTSSLLKILEQEELQAYEQTALKKARFQIDKILLIKEEDARIRRLFR